MFSKIPEEVLDAFKRAAKNSALDHYVGNGFAINNHYYYGKIYIFSSSIGVSSAKGLRILSALAKQGVIVEKPQPRKGHTRVFTLNEEQEKALWDDAVKHWRSYGYSEKNVLSRRH